MARLYHCVIAEVDYVVIRKKTKKLFKTVEEQGLVPYSTIMKDLGDFFEPFEYPNVPGLKILRQDNADRMAKQFAALKVGPDLTDFGQMAAMDSFINYRR